jgi:invasion protein IalB
MTTRKAALMCGLVVLGFFAVLALAKRTDAEIPKAGAAAAPADTDVADYNDWRFACTAVKGGQKDCRIFQLWSKGQGKAESLLVVIVPLVGVPAPKDKPKEKPVALMRLIAPLGADLRPGLAMVVGSKGKQINLPYEFCRRAGCFVNIAVSADFIAKVKAADTLLVAYREPGEKATTVKVSLKGFAAAFDAVAKTGHARGKG